MNPLTRDEVAKLLDLTELDQEGGLHRQTFIDEHVVEAGVWQGSMSLGEWTLLGTTMAPGFTWDGFELASEEMLTAHGIETLHAKLHEGQ